MKPLLHRIIGLGMLAAMGLVTGCSNRGTAKIQLNISPEITTADIYDHIAYLADDALAGRFPGTEGNEMAAAYIADNFAFIGLEAFPGFDVYYQRMNFTSAVDIGSKSKVVVGGTALELGTDYYPLPYSTQGEFSGPVATVGYGFSIDTDTLKWDDYAGLELAGKWVLMIDGAPAAIENDIEPGKEMLKQKVLAAKDRAIKGILVVGGTSHEGTEPIQASFDREFRDSGVMVISITDIVGDNLLGSTGSIDALRAAAGIEGGGASKDTDVVVDGAIYMTEINHVIKNVVGYIEGSDPQLKGQYIIIGGHYDHLGYGGVGSGSMVQEEHAIHNGADDNASGTAGMLEMAHKFATNGSARSMIFIGFNAEEEGLLGSKYFTNNLPVDKDSIAMMINMDMIGRLRNDRLTIGGTGTAPIFERVLPEFNRGYQFDLNMMPEGPGPSDHASFYYKDIPVLFVFTGAHEDYHKPTDDVVGIDTAGVVRVVSLIYDVASYFSERPARPVFEASAMASNTPSRRSFRVTFGVIPGYGANVNGMALDGVKEGGPAETAGLKKGDVIVGINDHEISNIQDYMYRLSKLKKGAVVQVRVNRAGKIMEFTLSL